MVLAQCRRGWSHTARAPPGPRWGVHNRVPLQLRALGSSGGNEGQGKARPGGAACALGVGDLARGHEGGCRDTQTDFGPVFWPLFQTKGKERFPCWTQTIPTTCSFAWRPLCPPLRAASCASTWVHSGVPQRRSPAPPGPGGRRGRGCLPAPMAHVSKGDQV